MLTSQAHSIPPIIKLQSKPCHSSSSLSSRPQLPAECHPFFLPDLMPDARLYTLQKTLRKLLWGHCIPVRTLRQRVHWLPSPTSTKCSAQAVQPIARALHCWLCHWPRLGRCLHTHASANKHLSMPLRSPDQLLPLPYHPGPFSQTALLRPASGA